MRASMWTWRAPHLHNFGDELGVPIASHFLDLDIVRAPRPEDADLAVVGSMLGLLPSGWSGIIAGAGALKSSPMLGIALRNALVLGVRGKLTREDLGLVGEHARVQLGDPGLLVRELVPVNDTERETIGIGVLPHWTDRSTGELFKRFKHLNPTLIDPAWDYDVVVRMVAQCQKLVTSSLHGVVVADAFGIARRVERFPAMNRASEGGEFKFHDYATALGEDMVFGERARAVPGWKVERVQAGLFDMLAELKEIVHVPS